MPALASSVFSYLRGLIIVYLQFLRSYQKAVVNEAEVRTQTVSFPHLPLSLFKLHARFVAFHSSLAMRLGAESPPACMRVSSLEISTAAVGHEVSVNRWSVAGVGVSLCPLRLG